jgi:circadian clock protein KaiC
MKSEKKVVKNIKTIERVSTGIKEIDNISEGGYEKNSTNLIIGDGGSGKTIFGVQFLMDGMKKDEKCLYITFEEKKSDFYKNMDKMGFDLEDLEENDKFFFIQYSPEKVKTMLEEGGGIIESLILRKKIKRVVIDSMTSFGLLFESDLEKRSSLLSLFSMLKKWECTTLLTYEGNTQDNKIAPDILELESDSIIILYFTRGKKERERSLEILKMRGTKHSSQLYGYTIGKGGISFGKKDVSNGDYSNPAKN